MRVKLLSAAVFLAIATPATAGDCYSWQALTCNSETATIQDKSRNIVGYVDSEGRILGKDRSIKGYISKGKILGKDRREELKFEGLPERYSPILD